MKKILLISTTVLMISACSDTTDPLLDGCMTIGMKEQMVGMEESSRYSVQKGVEQGCQMFVKECEKSPEGKICAAIKKQYIINDQ